MFTCLDARKLILNTHRDLQKKGYSFNKECIIRNCKLNLKESHYMEQLKTLNFVIENEWNNIFK